MTSQLMTMKHVRPLSEGELTGVLLWVDEMPLSREKRNLTRDFSDGVTVAEIVKRFQPKVVSLFQFTPSNSTSAKLANWHHLNRTVLTHIGVELTNDVIDALAQCRPWVVENLLLILRDRLQPGGGVTAPGGGANPHVPLQAPPGGESINPYVPAGRAAASRVAGEQGVTRGEVGHKYNYVGAGPSGHPAAVCHCADLNARVGGASLQDTPTRRPLAATTTNVKPLNQREMNDLESLHRTIESLTRDVLRLEHTVRLKDIRIEDLSARLEQEGLLHPPSSPPSAELTPAAPRGKQMTSQMTSSPRHRGAAGPGVRPAYGK